jgi:hypothetical protein
MYKRAHELLFVEGIDPNLPVGNQDHFGEFETEVEAMEVRYKRTRSGLREPGYIQLQGMPSKYPEPE